MVNYVEGLTWDPGCTGVGYKWGLRGDGGSKLVILSLN